MSQESDSERLPFEHPYWDPRGVLKLHEFGFERDYLIMLAELENSERRRVTHEIHKTARMLKEHYGDEFMPQQLAYMMLQTAERDGRCSFMDRIIENEETIDSLRFDEGLAWEIHQAYHPDRRLLMQPFQAGVTEDGVIHDALGPFSSHRNLLVDQHGGLHELIVQDGHDA